MANLLSLIDPEFTKDKKEKEYINKLKKAVNICDNPEFGTDSVYKYLVDDAPVHIKFFEYTHDWKKIVPIEAKYIIEVANRNIKPIFFFKFIDGLYTWEYDKSKIMIEFRYNEKEKHSKFIYIFNDVLTEFGKEDDL